MKCEIGQPCSHPAVWHVLAYFLRELNADAVDLSPPDLACQQPVVRELQIEGVRCGERVLDLDHRTGIGQVSDGAIEDRMSVIEYDLGTKKRSFSR